MARTPAPHRLVSNAWFVLWLLGGVALVVLTCVLTEIYIEEFWSISTFKLLNPPPGYENRRLLIESIFQLPWVGLVYGLVGAWVFRRRGCVAIACAVAIAGGSFLAQIAPGLGRL